jgi:hypothetical protein
MKGTMLIIPPGDIDVRPEVRRFDRPPSLDELTSAVGGYLEAVPWFTTVAFAGTVFNCVAFCNEHGKINHLPLNEGATMQWQRALKRHGQSLHDDRNQAPKDWLVGPVVVLFGDREFMESL